MIESQLPAPNVEVIAPAYWQVSNKKSINEVLPADYKEINLII